MPVNIITHHDPAGINKREFTSLPNGTKLLDYFIDNYGADGFSVPTRIFDGDVCLENEISHDNFDQINKPFSNCTINVIHRPQGVELVVALIVSIAASVLLAPDISPAPQPENPNFPRTNESPNNNLTGQSNISRPLSRIPDIYGKMKVFPDLGAKTVTEFIDHIKQVTEYLIIGRGSYLVEQIKSGQTNIESIVNTSVQFYEPDQIIPELIDQSQSNEVNGQTLKAPNETAGSTVNFSCSFSGNYLDDDAGGNLQQLGVMSQGDQFSVAGTDNGNDGVYTFNHIVTTPQPPEEGVSAYRVYVDESFNVEPYNTGRSANLPSSDAAAVLVGAFKVPNTPTTEVWVDLQAPRGLADRIGGVSSPITVQVRVILERLDDQDNIVFTEVSDFDLIGETLDPRFYTFKIIPLDPTASYQVSMTKLSSTINDPAYYDTIKWTSLSGVNRIANFDQGNVTSYVLTTSATDQATSGSSRQFNAVVTRKLPTWDNVNKLLIGVSPFQLVNYLVTTTANGNTFTVDGNTYPEFIKFNDLISGDIFRVTNDNLNGGIYIFQSLTQDAITKLFTLTVSDLTPLAQTNQPTNFSFSGKGSATVKFADAMLNHLIDPLIGNKSLESIDVDDLYAIQDQLDADPIYTMGELGRFCQSFSADKSSVKDELFVIGNAARCFVKKYGDRIGFGRDEVKPIRVSLLNGRIKKPNSEKKTIKMQKITDYDGIELQWLFEDTGDAYTVHFPESKTAINPKKIEATGIRNHGQAWNRARLEFQKLKLQRETVETTVTKDGLNLQIGDRVSNADGTTVKTQQGEILAVNGLIVDTSEPVDFKSQGNATIIIRSESGNQSEEITVSPRADNLNGFVLTALPVNFNIVFRGVNGYQVGTIYNFFTLLDLTIKDYIVQKITPTSNGYVKLSLTKYNNDIYLGDTETPPPHETVIILALN